LRNADTTTLEQKQNAYTTLLGMVERGALNNDEAFQTLSLLSDYHLYEPDPNNPPHNKQTRLFPFGSPQFNQTLDLIYSKVFKNQHMDAGQRKWGYEKLCQQSFPHFTADDKQTAKAWYAPRGLDERNARA
jgi:hypothetical protein